HQWLGLDAALVVHRLRAVAAVLGTSAGLDRQQLAHLDLVGAVVLAVDGRGAVHELEQRLREQRAHVRERPVRANRRERARHGRGRYCGTCSVAPSGGSLTVSTAPPSGAFAADAVPPWARAISS